MKSTLARWVVLVVLAGMAMSARPQISPPPPAPIIDNALNAWTVVDGIIYRNGALAGFSAAVTSLIYYNSTIYQQNAAGGWWSWNGSGWTTESGDPRVFLGFDCIPGFLGGTGLGFAQVNSSFGRGWWWVCKSPTGVKWYSLILLDSYVPPHGCAAPLGEFAAEIAKAPGDVIGAVNRALGRCSAEPDPANVAGIQANELRAMAREAAAVAFPPVVVAPVPPSPAFVVAPYALSKTTPPSRPVFAFGRGRRIAQVYTLAEVGQACKPEIASVTEGTVRYMAFGPAFSPIEVTVCIPKP